MDEIKIDTSYSNYDAIQYYKFEYLLQTPVNSVLDGLLKELDSTVMCKNMQILPLSSWRYSDIVNKFIRILLRIPLYDYELYNKYVDLLYTRHKENVDFENLRIIPENNSATSGDKPVSSRNSRKRKIPNKFIRTETHNLFTGALVYDYTNFATGESFISDNPNLLEELNAPKKKVKAKKAPKKEFGKIILNFKMK